MFTFASTFFKTIKIVFYSRNSLYSAELPIQGSVQSEHLLHSQPENQEPRVKDVADDWLLAIC